VAAKIHSPDVVTLLEVVAFLAPPLEVDVAREAIARAVCDGRLTDEPTPIVSASDIAAFHLPAYLVPSSTNMHSWRSRFSEGRVNWERGSVSVVVESNETGRRTIEVWPTFRRAEVLALFGAKPQETKAATVSRNDLARFLDDLLDGTIREVDAKTRAQRHFASKRIPDDLWRRCWGAIGPAKRRSRGRPKKIISA
jgi:hypothetical protein